MRNSRNAGAFQPCAGARQVFVQRRDRALERRHQAERDRQLRARACEAEKISIHIYQMKFGEKKLLIKIYHTID